MHKRIFWTTLGTGAAAIIAIVSALLWFAAHADEYSAKELSSHAEAVLENTMQQLEIAASGIAYSDTLYTWYMSGNDAALLANVGNHSAPGGPLEVIMLISPDGEMTHAYRDGEQDDDPGSFRHPGTDAFLSGPTDQSLFNVPVVSGLVATDDDIFLTVGALVHPAQYAATDRADVPRLVAAASFDPVEFARDLRVEDASIVRLPETVPPERSSLPLHSFDATPLGYLTWPMPQTGQFLLRQAMPVVVMLIALIGLVTAIAARLMSQQTENYLREKTSARTDPLTGLLNRLGLEEAVNHPGIQHHLANLSLAAISIDLNGLKPLNDTYGHAVGDAAIQATARRLKQSVRACDFVARTGGDEFLCIIIDDTPADTALAVAERITNLTAQPITAGGQSYVARASIGIAWAEGETDLNTVVNRADDAMYQAKRSKSEMAITYREILDFTG